MRECERIRRQHAEGKLPLATARRFDALPGFRWVEIEDYSKTIGKDARPQPAAAFTQMLIRNPQATKREVLAQDNAVRGTVREAARFIRQAREARAQAKALEGTPQGQAQAGIWNRATKVMSPSIEAFKVWATWVDKAQAPAPLEESKTAPKPARQVGNW
jgi:hypothetical protein